MLPTLLFRHNNFKIRSYRLIFEFYNVQIYFKNFEFILYLVVEIIDNKEPSQPCEPERRTSRQLSELQRLTGRPVISRCAFKPRPQQPPRLREVSGVPTRTSREDLDSENAKLQSAPNSGRQCGPLLCQVKHKQGRQESQLNIQSADHEEVSRPQISVTDRCQFLQQHDKQPDWARIWYWPWLKPRQVGGLTGWAKYAQ